MKRVLNRRGTHILAAISLSWGCADGISSTMNSDASHADAAPFDASPADAGPMSDETDAGPRAPADAEVVEMRDSSVTSAPACEDGLLAWGSDFEDGSLEGTYLHGMAEVTGERPMSGTRSLRYRYRPSGKWGIAGLDDFQEAYVEYWAYNQDMPCTGCISGGKHYFRFVYWPPGGGSWTGQIDTEAREGGISAHWFDFTPDNPGRGQGRSHPSSFESGTWHRVRVGFRGNTLGNADGRFIWMIDDEVVIDITGEMFGPGEGLNAFIFTNYDYQPDRGDPSGLVPTTYIDDFAMRTGPGAFDCLPAGTR